MSAQKRHRGFSLLAEGLPALCLLALLASPACVRVRTEVEPIDINVNVRLEVDRELDEFFEELDAEDPTLVDSEEEAES